LGSFETSNIQKAFDVEKEGASFENIDYSYTIVMMVEQNGWRWARLKLATFKRPLMYRRREPVVNTSIWVLKNWL
jgi:hypothetical protein